MHDVTNVEKSTLIGVRSVLEMYDRNRLKEINIDRDHLVLVLVMIKFCVWKLITESWIVIHTVDIKISLYFLHYWLKRVIVFYEQLIPV